MSLKDYAKKRNFEKTMEPAAQIQRRDSKSNNFVIQKHAASHLHYDFRLQLDGILKSWAVPKGVPFKKGEKRLAIQVEDHPVSYREFEGTIPKGEYGGGTVMVWDKGIFELLDIPGNNLKAGKLQFLLHGSKLEGEWYLVRLRNGKEWLLIKGGRDMRPVSKRLDNTSVISGKTIAQIGSKYPPKRVPPKTNDRKKRFKDPQFIEPMQAKLVEEAPAGDWVYEIKFDGIRAIALKNGEKITLLSRNSNDLSERFSEVVAALKRLPVEQVSLDGEIVVLDKKGRSSFQLLQDYQRSQEGSPLFFYAFDLLMANGQDLTQASIDDRRKRLGRLIRAEKGVIRLSKSLEGDSHRLLDKARKLGLEGLIGKRKNSRYEPGRRSGAWIKLKLRPEQEFVIGGYTEPAGSRKHFGALLVGVYEKNKLRFTGKVGSGFTGESLQLLYLQMKKLERIKCPFLNLPERVPGRYGQGVTTSEMKRCHWLKPSLVCQIQFAEWTREGKLRQPAFLGLRQDKQAEEVVKEESL